MTLAPLPLFFTGWGLVALMMAVLWLVQRARRDAGVVDVGWSAGVGILALLFAWLSPGWLPRRVLLAALAGAWSSRLAFFLLRNRIWGAHEEDGRYQDLRRAWGGRQQLYLFLFFQAQGLIDALLALTFLVILQKSAPAFTAWDFAAVAIWLVAVVGEATADAQLARFRAEPSNRGRTCRVGLWGWSRHPNYFFEFLHWFTYPLLAVGAPGAWIAWFAPALMFYFLWKVTGIPATEARAIQSRGEDYRRYQREVSVFVPLPPGRPRH